MPLIKVRYADPLIWGFDDSDPREPMGYGWTLVDPCPAYAQDYEVVVRVAQNVAVACPPLQPVSIVIGRYEPTSRTNGYTNMENDYVELEDGKHKYVPKMGHIVLHAKRIPVHPGMTAYLVAHEYGHVVEKWVDWVRGLKADTTEELYGDLRGLKPSPPYGAGAWHLTRGEVFANDFRILVCGIEPQYWPHPGVTRPDDPVLATTLREWWRKALDDFEEHRRAAAAQAS